MDYLDILTNLLFFVSENNKGGKDVGGNQDNAKDTHQIKNNFQEEKMKSEKDDKPKLKSEKDHKEPDKTAVVEQKAKEIPKENHTHANSGKVDKPEKPEEEEVDIDLNDPEVEQAALKIQSKFRGFKSKKAVTSESQTQSSTESKVTKPKANTTESQPQSSPEARVNKESKTEKPEEEEIDIDLNDPEVENAALKIQSKFRGFKSKKKATTQSETQSSPEGNVNKTKAPSTEIQTQTSPETKAIKTGKNEQPEEEEIDIDLNDPEVENAALKIQNKFRGFKSKKKTDAKNNTKSSPEGKTQTSKANTAENQTQSSPVADVSKGSKSAKPEEEEIDIDLNDPEVADAALKIQKNFRGFRSKKAAATNKQETQPSKQESVTKDKKDVQPEEEEIDIDLNDPEVAEAALKIQKNFRGFKKKKK